MRIIGAAVAAAILASAAQAAPVDGGAARKMLFGVKGNEVQLAEGGMVDQNVAKAIRQAAGQIAYYGAIAVSPGEPAASNLMSVMANYHSPEAASAAALANCNSRRTSGKPCVVIAVVTPKRYQPKPLTMSAEATAAFNKEFRRLKKPRGMAISPGTGVFGIDRGDGGRAVSRCNSAAAAKGAQDCRLVIVDQ